MENMKYLLYGGPSRRHRRCKLRAVEGSLYLVSFSDYAHCNFVDQYYAICCDVWVWRKDEGWMKLFSSKHPRLCVEDTWRFGYSISILCSIGNGKILIREKGRDLVLCNLRDDSSKKIVVQGQDSQWYAYLQYIVPYEEIFG